MKNERRVGPRWTNKLGLIIGLLKKGSKVQSMHSARIANAMNVSICADQVFALFYYAMGK